MQARPLLATKEVVFVDDFLLRQIQQIADLVAAIARSPHGQLPDDLFAQIDQAYRDLLGLDSDLVDSLDTESLRRTLHDERERDALIDLLLAHAEASARIGDVSGAARRLDTAIALMREADTRAETANARLVELRS